MDDLQTEAAHRAPNLMREAAAFEGWPLRAKLEALGIILVVVAVVLAWAFWPAPPIHEDVAPAPEVRQADNSVIAERAPDANPAPPRHIMPKGAIEERRGEIVAAPAAGASSVEVDYSLARMPDGGRRVIVSSPDGSIDRAIDIPIEQGLVPPPPKPWSAGLSYDTRHAIGIWVDRDIGRLVVGAAVSRLPDGRAEAQLRVGMRF